MPSVFGKSHLRFAMMVTLSFVQGLSLDPNFYLGTFT